MTTKQNFYKLLLRVRPAPVAVAIKRAFNIRRRAIVTSYGTFFVDPVSVFGFQLITSGEYEPEMVRTVRETLPRGGVFLDVGANEGFFTVVGAQTASHVVAVEPQARLQSVIRENARLNACSNVTVLQCALSDHCGTDPLYIAPDINSGSSGLARSTQYRLPIQPTEVITMTELLDRVKFEFVDLMKMDIEGFEYEAILGSQSVFIKKRIKTIALELHPTRLEKRGLSAQPITDFLGSCGYIRDSRFKNLVLTAA